MKIKYLFFLITILMCLKVASQLKVTYLFDTYKRNLNATDNLFNNPAPGECRANFNFFNVDNKELKLNLELYTIRQLYSLPNLDSVMGVVKNYITLLKDSLPQDILSRRLDIAFENKNPICRIITYNTNYQTYAFKEEELHLLKLEQDTVRIKLLIPTGDSITTRYFDNSKSKFNQAVLRPVYFTIILNNVLDVINVNNNCLNSCLQILKQDISKEYVEKNQPWKEYKATYNVPKQIRLWPEKKQWIRGGENNKELVPSIYVSAQVPRGIFMPSLAAGFRYTPNKYQKQKNYYFLASELYYNFYSIANNKTASYLYHFLVFRYLQVNDNDNASFKIIPNFSIGYLLNNNYTSFGGNNIKFNIPAVRSGWLQIEPEFYFNGLFKNFSPSIKLTIHYE